MAEDKQQDEQMQAEAAQEEQEKQPKSVSVDDRPDCEKCEAYLGGWKRALADYDNLKKQLSKERGEIREHVKIDAAQILLPVLDNFDQALKFVPKDIDKPVENWLSGVTHIRNQLEQVLSEMGVAPYGAVGETFDPNLHDAAEKRAAEDKPDQTILEVVQRGWKLGEHIIRPAKVIVNDLD